MNAEAFRCLKRGDVIRVGRTIRVVQLGLGDLDSRGIRSAWVVFGKLVRTGYPRASTCYFYGDIGRRTELIRRPRKSAALLAADLERVGSLGYNARREMVKAMKEVRQAHRAGWWKVKSLCVAGSPR